MLGYQTPISNRDYIWNYEITFNDVYFSFIFRVWTLVFFGWENKKCF